MKWLASPLLYVLPAVLRVHGRCRTWVGFGMTTALSLLRNRLRISVPRPSLIKGSVWISVGIAASWLFAQPAIGIFSVGWVLAEASWALRTRLASPSSRRLKKLASLIAELSNSDAHSEYLLEQRIKDLEIHGELDEYETKWLERLRELFQLRSLAFGKRAQGRLGLRQTFVRASLASGRGSAEIADSSSVEDVLESAIATSELLWKLYRVCNGEFPELKPVALAIFEVLFARRFEPEHAREFFAAHTDRMAREHGLPFLILSYIKLGETQNARAQMQAMVEQEAFNDEELRTALYWIAELSWFTREGGITLDDHQATVRYLYHLCFSGPERAGFLEIDSQFFEEFELINELAREGFSFRESLFEKVLQLWEPYEGSFDTVFRHFLEQVSGQTSKVYDHRRSWLRYWNRERETFSRDYLLVIEGNLSYLSGQYEDAIEFYREALQLNPNLRSARLNRVFAAARAERRTQQWAFAHEIANAPELFPAGLFAAANSYVLSKDADTAEHFYAMLRAQQGWELKADFYRSTFCFAQGMAEEAVQAAERALELNPHDTSIRFHLSQCYNAIGSKDRALELVRQLGHEPQWLSYYRFTLERDNGLTHEATKTLRELPAAYFEDPEELEAAMRFAKDQKDFALMRHLKDKRSA